MCRTLNLWMTGWVPTNRPSGPQQVKTSSPLFHWPSCPPPIFLARTQSSINPCKTRLEVKKQSHHHFSIFLPPHNLRSAPNQTSIEVKLDLQVRRRLASDHSPDLAQFTPGPILFVQFRLFGNQVRRIILCRFSGGTRGDGPPYYGPPYDGPPCNGPPYYGPPYDGPPLQWSPIVHWWHATGGPSDASIHLKLPHHAPTYVMIITHLLVL